MFAVKGSLRASKYGQEPSMLFCLWTLAKTVAKVQQIKDMSKRRIKKDQQGLCGNGEKAVLLPAKRKDRNNIYSKSRDIYYVYIGMGRIRDCLDSLS